MKQRHLEVLLVGIFTATALTSARAQLDVENLATLGQQELPNMGQTTA